jgi:hypothetical protein
MTRDPPDFETDRPRPAWFGQAVASLNEASMLAANWDSYGAPAIRRSSSLAALKLLAQITTQTTPRPSIVPTNRGTVMLEWHTRGIDLEIEAIGPGKFHVAFEHLGGTDAWESEVGADVSILVQCVERLSS